jgi:hypothetical protein
MEQPVKTMKLPSGKTATFEPFVGKHVRKAAQMSNGDNTKIVFAMIALTVQIDGQAVVMEDLDEMNGQDVLALMGEFSSNFTSTPEN